MKADVKVRGLVVLLALAILVIGVAPAQGHMSSQFGHVYNHIKTKFAREVVTAQVSIAPGDNEFVSVDCPAGKQVLGGGVDAEQSNFGHSSVQRIIESYPTETGWEAFVANESSEQDDPNPRTARVYAICGVI